MRLLYVSHSFPLPDRPLSNVGGMQRVAVDLQRALAAHRDIQLTTLVLESDARWTGVRTLGFLGSLLRSIPRIVREERIDAVLFSSMVTASTVVLLQDRIAGMGAITAAIPVGRDITLANPTYQWFVRKVLSRLDLILPISRATAATALVRGAPAERVRVVPCGVDLPALSSASSRAEDRRVLLDHLRSTGHAIDEGDLLLLSVGRHQKRKGFHWFVDEVVPLLPPGVRYLLAGVGPMTGTIERKVREGRLGDRVILLGRVTEERLVQLYRGSDLFIMPNIPVAGDIEGFGVVMIEAGAAGLPVVAADLEGIQDVITPGENGSLIKAGDAQGFAGAIERYGDARVRNEESSRVARYVRERFGWPGIADQHLTLIREVLRSVREDSPPPAQDRDQPAEHLGQ